MRESSRGSVGTDSTTQLKPRPAPRELLTRHPEKPVLVFVQDPADITEDAQQWPTVQKARSHDADHRVEKMRRGKAQLDHRKASLTSHATGLGQAIWRCAHADAIPSLSNHTLRSRCSPTPRSMSSSAAAKRDTQGSGPDPSCF